MRLTNGNQKDCDSDKLNGYLRGILLRAG